MPDPRSVISLYNHIAKPSPPPGGLFFWAVVSRGLRAKHAGLTFLRQAATVSAERTPGGTTPDERGPAMSDAESSDRLLGVVEAILAVQNQCPHAHVREHARQALEAVQQGGAEALRQQAFLVLATLAGWRGARADQVKRSLEHFVAGETPA